MLRARVSHGSYAVSIRMVFDDLQRLGIQWFYVQVHTPGVTSWFILETKDGQRQGTAFQDVEGEWARAPWIDRHIDYASDVVTLRVPRSMLGGPPWVRVRVRNELGLPDGAFFTDNPTTPDPETVFTPRLHGVDR